MDNIIIGKRIKFGQIVLSLFTVFGFVWDWMNPENPVPAGLVLVIAQTITGIGQVWIANKLGVTTK